MSNISVAGIFLKMVLSLQISPPKTNVREDMEKRESSFTVVGISNLSTHSGNTYSMFTDLKGQFSILIRKNKQANK